MVGIITPAAAGDLPGGDGRRLQPRDPPPPARPCRTVPHGGGDRDLASRPFRGLRLRGRDQRRGLRRHPRPRRAQARRHDRRHIARACGPHAPTRWPRSSHTLDPTQYLGAVAGGLQDFASNAFLVLVYLGFLIASRHAFERKAVQAVPHAARTGTRRGGSSCASATAWSAICGSRRSPAWSSPPPPGW